MGKFRREVRAQEALAAKKERNKLMFGAAAVLVAGGGIVGVAVVQNHNDLYGTYCKVGDHEISKLEYEFFYNSTVNNFLTSYGYYLSYIGLDTSKPFSEQEYSEGVTWEQYFQGQALELMKEVYVLSDAAKEAKFEMNQETYDNFFADIEEYSKEYKLSTDEYLKEMYGNNASKKNIDEILKTYFLASDYASHLQENELVPTDEEILAYYDEHKADYDNVSYRMFAVYADPAAGVEVEADKENEKKEYTAEEWAVAMGEAKKTAEEFFEQVYDEETFKELCVKYAKDDAAKKEYESGDASLFKDMEKSTMNTAVAEWLMDDKREKDATAIIEDSENHVYYIVYFLDRDRDDTPTVDVRHILIAPETVEKPAEDASDEAMAEYEAKVKEAKEAAKAKADELFASWKEVGTEEKFIEMANEHSADSPADGLYTGVKQGEMVPEFNDWIFAEGRQTGDNDIVETTYGYHIMYYVAPNQPAWKNTIRDNLISQAYNDFIAERIESYVFEDVKGKLTIVNTEEHDHEHDHAEESITDTTVEAPAEGETVEGTDVPVEGENTDATQAPAESETEAEVTDGE